MQLERDNYQQVERFLNEPSGIQPTGAVTQEP